MSLQQLEKSIFQVANDPLRRELFEQDRDKLLSGYELSGEELRAVVEVDITTLFEMKVEPLLIQPFAALHNLSSAELFGATRKAKNWDNRNTK